MLCNHKCGKYNSEHTLYEWRYAKQTTIVNAPYIWSVKGWLAGCFKNDLCICVWVDTNFSLNRFCRCMAPQVQFNFIATDNSALNLLNFFGIIFSTVYLQYVCVTYVGICIEIEIEKPNDNKQRIWQ